MRSRHALALTCTALGRDDEAIALHELNLTERLRYLSPGNPNTTDTIDALEAARSKIVRTSTPERRPARAYPAAARPS
jgi:hypothetical protein